ncbi:pyridoxamine 5'-phosphate oxidase family protein [Candidatus Pacearchaeota archaeon]|nr:pyridoxamine 5'-phosphate oxidase family protein [Candidatus Pacearchaeota archaeon]
MNKKKIDWKRHVKEIMDMTDFMAITTSNKSETWTNPVYFAYDDSFNLYFLSLLKTKHIQNISKNSRVSGAIFSTKKLTEDDVAGIQFSGKASIIQSKSDIEKATKFYYGRSQPKIDYRKKINDHFGKDVKYHFVKIIPDEIWIFDTRYFDEETEGRQKVPSKIYKK